MANTLNLGTDGNWGTKEGSVLGYNSENNNFKPLPFEFERGGSATRVNKEGLIEVVGNNEPRIDFKDNSKGALLLEPSRSNLITYSENLNGAGWSVYGASGGTCTRTLNYGISPQGIQNSTRVVFSGSNTALYFITSINAEATASMYVKGVAGEIIGFGFGQSVAGGFDFVFNGEWQRLEFTSTSINYALTINTWAASRNARDFEVYGVQMEIGSYATSYIPTSGSAVTRVAETCTGAGNDQVINSKEGVLYAEIDPISWTDVAPNYYKTITLSNNSTTNRVFIGITSSAQLALGISVGGNNTFFTETAIPQVNSKIAIKWNATSLTAYLNGSQHLTTLSGSFNFATNILDTLNFNQGTASYVFYGNTKDVRVYNTALTDAELISLTQV